MEKQTRNVFGIIHIGTVNMTLKVIAYSSLDDMEIIENVSREVKYGETVFKRHNVSFQSLNEICGFEYFGTHHIPLTAGSLTCSSTRSISARASMSKSSI